jgi:hypothetical protein
MEATKWEKIFSFDTFRGALDIPVARKLLRIKA